MTEIVKRWSRGRQVITTGYVGSACEAADSLRAWALSCSSHKLFLTRRGTSSSMCCRTFSRKIRYHRTLNLSVGRQGSTTMPTLDYKIWIFCSYCHLCKLEMVSHNLGSRILFAKWLCRNNHENASFICRRFRSRTSIQIPITKSIPSIFFLL